MSDSDPYEMAEDAFEEWWANEGEDHFTHDGDEQIKANHRTTFIDAYVMGYNER